MNYQRPNRNAITGIVIGFLASLMIFFPALLLKNSDAFLTGIQVIFGHDHLRLEGILNGHIGFSFANFLAYLFPLAASVSLLFTRRGFLCSSILFAIGTILLLSVPRFTVVTYTILGSVTEASIDWHLGIGLIIAITLSLFGTLSSTLLAVLNRE